jgi:small-conductance mechanosensitive channel
MRFYHRTLDAVRVPTVPEAMRRPKLRLVVACAVVAVAALVAAGAFGNIHGHLLRSRIVAASGAAAFLLASAIGVRRAADELASIIEGRTGRGHAAVIRVLVTVAGYLIALLVTLGILDVPVQHLLLGGALTGVIIGIAAQQALGNFFAGLVLLLARPFNVGDSVRVRSGALGGEFTGTITGMGLTYVTIDTETGALSVPNGALLASAIGPRPDPSAVPTSGQPGSPPASPPAPARPGPRPGRRR